jgi:hypothetical protein
LFSEDYTAGDPPRTIGWRNLGGGLDGARRMTPAEVIVASTRLTAETLKLDHSMVAPGKSACRAQCELWTASPTREDL